MDQPGLDPQTREQLQRIQLLREELSAAAELNRLRNLPPDTPRAPRSTDATSVSFPARLVIEIVAIALTVAGAIWATSYGLRSDVRDILTRMEYQQRLNDERNTAWNGKIAEVRMQLTKSEGAIEELRKQVGDLREKFIASQPQRSRP